jgi:hypothetical protein
MTLIYVWKPAGVAQDAAARHFAAVVEGQAADYSRAFGRPFTPRQRRVGPLFVGLVAGETGVSGWQPWQECAGFGLAWAGIAEEVLGRQPEPEALARRLAAAPEHVAGWGGRFAVCAWDEAAGQATLTTGAASPTLWCTEGPRGWAAGSRALPLLALAGWPAELDLAAAGVFVACGYLAGTGSLLRRVERVGPRRHLTLGAQAGAARTYVGLPEYLGPGGSRAWGEVVEEQAEALVARVRRQLDHSEQPLLLLTGGRDSRCIAAAAVAAGYGGSARTSGPHDLPDVRIAARVAAALGIRHEREGGHGPAAMAALAANAERRLLWARLGEGVETVRHALAFQPFFEGRAPFPERQEQVFHGLHGLAGEGTRTALYKRAGIPSRRLVDLGAAEAAILAQVPDWLRVGPAARAAIGEAVGRLNAELGHAPIGEDRWFTLFYWQSRALQWGVDAMGVKDVMAWRWTPLLDGGLVRAFFSTQGGTGKELLEAITAVSAPQLRGIAYDKGPDTPLRKAKQGLKRALGAAERAGLPLPWRAGRATKVPAGPELLALWEQVFFIPRPRVWPELVDEGELRAQIAARPSGEALWNLATVELLGQALDAGA